ncbi:MAG: hypothetical protein ACYDHE_19680 [Candidatus Acidiferrales bacterium]
MSQFFTMEDDVLEFLKERERLEVNRPATIDAICMRYPGLARVDAVNLVLYLEANGKLERRNDDWRLAPAGPAR